MLRTLQRVGPALSKRERLAIAARFAGFDIVDAAAFGRSDAPCVYTEGPIYADTRPLGMVRTKHSRVLLNMRGVDIGGLRLVLAALYGVDPSDVRRWGDSVVVLHSRCTIEASK